MILSHDYSTKFICSFDLSYYPFDTQKCSMKLKLDVRNSFCNIPQLKKKLSSTIQRSVCGNFANLTKGTLEYRGPMDLTQYYIEGYTMEENVKRALGGRRKKAAIVVEFTFKRTVLNEMLTTFLPSAAVCIVSFSTNFYKVKGISCS